MSTASKCSFRWPWCWVAILWGCICISRSDCHGGGRPAGRRQGRHSAISDTTREHLDALWERIDEILNTLLFVLLGLEVLLIPFELAYLWAGAGLVVILLVVRFTIIGGPVMLLRDQLGFRRGTDPDLGRSARGNLGRSGTGLAGW